MVLYNGKGTYLDLDLSGGEAVGLEHVGEHLLLVLERVERGLRQQDLVVRGVDVEALVEGVVPEGAHAIPVANLGRASNHREASGARQGARGGETAQRRRR